MIGQTTNQANNPPKDGTILPPTIDGDKHELTEQELADMTPMRLAERIQQMEEAFKLLGPVEDVLNRHHLHDRLLLPFFVRLFVQLYFL